MAAIEWHRDQHDTAAELAACREAGGIVDLPCGCQDVYFPCGNVSREHDHVICDGQPTDGDTESYPFYPLPA